jgi:biopolymer transport protein ExbD
MTRSRISFARENAIEEPAVNLTPLIDVVFVILIMFIVIAPLLELDQVELAEGANMPQTTRSVQESSPVAIHVREDNTIWFNSQSVTPLQLAILLKNAKAQHPKVIPQVFHDKRAQFGTYQAVKNAAEEAGYSQMEIILKPA